VSKVPNLNYNKVLRALKRDGWVVVRQKGSHIRLQKNIKKDVLKLTIPAHRPIKRSTLSHILKQANLELDRFLDLL
jgi:predicted RNA binding protein YcfA (HicA-like mRNA interferase family)